MFGKYLKVKVNAANDCYDIYSTHYFIIIYYLIFPEKSL